MVRLRLLVLLGMIFCGLGCGAEARPQIFVLVVDGTGGALRVPEDFDAFSIAVETVYDRDVETRFVERFDQTWPLVPTTGPALREAVALPQTLTVVQGDASSGTVRITVRGVRDGAPLQVGQRTMTFRAQAQTFVFYLTPNCIGVSCSDGEVCDPTGSCSTPVPPDAGVPIDGGGCEANELSCSGGCVPSDTLNCGACGRACAAAERCLAGVCACPAGLARCGGTCVDVSTDVGNCGTCGRACPTGDTCSGALCACEAMGGIVCAGTCLMSPVETCNGVDDDCDGTIDEGCACTDGMTRACGTDVGACTAGTQTCSGGAWGPCSGASPGTETCNGVDDDCDGSTDESLSRACSTACGSGTETCSGGGYRGCTAPLPGTETCNGIDDDCDGSTDEGLSRGCSTACGSGTETCSAGSWTGCTAPMPGSETCNGLDDDCDGSIDDGVVCSGCVRSVIGASTYQFCSSPLSWTAARDRCVAMGYHLVKISNATQNTAVRTACMGTNCWTGLWDENRDMTFYWQDGTSVVVSPPMGSICPAPMGSPTGYTAWSAGQPNCTGTGPLCVDVSIGVWYDTDCTLARTYLCEAP